MHVYVNRSLNSISPCKAVVNLQKIWTKPLHLYGFVLRYFYKQFEASNWYQRDKPERQMKIFLMKFESFLCSKDERKTYGNGMRVSN